MSGEPTYLKDFKALIRRDPTSADLAALERQVYHESDRATVILLSSMVEVALERLLKRKFRSDISNTNLKDIFESKNAPLSSFAAKIDIAYALNLIGPITKRDLDLIRHLRNGCAHSRIAIEFTNPVVKAVCDQLKTPDTAGSFIPHYYLQTVPDHQLGDASDRTHPKTRYITACFTVGERVLKLREVENPLPPSSLP